MIRKTWWAALAVCALIGCDPGAPQTAPTTGTGATGGATTPDPAAGLPGEGTGAAAATVELTAAEIENLKKLPEADAKPALEQKVCPVSDEHLGAEGMEPVKVSVEGQTVFLCCEGCKESIEKEPAKYLAKLGKGK